MLITRNPKPEVRQDRSRSLPASKFQLSKVGFPIRKSTDQRLFAPPRSLSQRTTSFIASYRQGIHQMPLGHLIALISNAHLMTTVPSKASHAVWQFGCRHCSERPEVIRDKPRRQPRLQASAMPSHSRARLRAPHGFGRRTDAASAPQAYPLFTMSRMPPHALRQAARGTVTLLCTDMVHRVTGMVEPDGIEPTTSSLQSYALSQLSYGPESGMAHDT